MTSQQALQLLAQVTAQLQLTLAQHQQIQLALQTLDALAKSEVK